MEIEVKKLYVDVFDEYQNSSLKIDGYLLSSFTDGYIGQDEYLIEEKYVTLERHIQNVILRNALRDKIKSYENSNWNGISDSKEFKAGMESRMATLDAVIGIIEGAKDE